ncbi:1163_t:CDS:2 [Racocetra fulgida]|uniref:1163_t:CDS:1 n=1 Tax=Racocetra fulgida TaxID=60492 RepID=A0A9N9AE45_9GLOM|nr:1163_t:CDS:2 [Racocetra fulgida]
MNHRNNLKAIKNSIKKFKNNIQLLLLSSDNSEILTDFAQINQDDTMIISDSEDEETQEQEKNNNAMSIEEWNKIFDPDEYAIISNQIVSNIITDHPLINKDAKWNLGSLFSQNLPKPPYFLEFE